MPYLNPDNFEIVRKALLAAQPSNPAMDAAVNVMAEALTATAPEDLRQQAIDLHRDGDEIEVDDDAAMSQGDEGAWVQAWLYVPGWGADDDEGCATCRDSIETRVMPCDECGAIDEED